MDHRIEWSVGGDLKASVNQIIRANRNATSVPERIIYDAGRRDRCFCFMNSRRSISAGRDRQAELRFLFFRSSLLALALSRSRENVSWIINEDRSRRDNTRLSVSQPTIISDAQLFSDWITVHVRMNEILFMKENASCNIFLFQLIMKFINVTQINSSKKKQTDKQSENAKG